MLGDVAGEEESPVYAIEKMNQAIGELQRARWLSDQGVQRLDCPTETDRLSMKWDGEWHITIEVFRDLGLAFAAVLVLIYVLVVGWFRSFITPLVIMAPDSTDARGHSAGACADGRVLHCDLDDWLYRRCGHHRAQFDHPG